MNREDIQKAMPDVRLPKIDLKRADIGKELAKAGKGLEKAGKDLDKVLPRRAAPSPLPFVFFGMLAGLFIGWFLASSTVTGPRIGSLADEVRARLASWRRTDFDYDTDDAGVYPDALRTPTSSYEGTTDAMNGVGMGSMGTTGTTAGTNGVGVGVGPGTLPDGVGASEGVSSERF